MYFAETFAPRLDVTAGPPRALLLRPAARVGRAPDRGVQINRSWRLDGPAAAQIWQRRLPLHSVLGRLDRQLIAVHAATAAVCWLESSLQTNRKEENVSRDGNTACLSLRAR